MSKFVREDWESYRIDPATLREALQKMLEAVERTSFYEEAWERLRYIIAPNGNCDSYNIDASELPELLKDKLTEVLKSWMDDVDFFSRYPRKAADLLRECLNVIRGKRQRDMKPKHGEGIARALAVLYLHPTWTKKEIAIEAEVDPSLLSKSDEFEAAWEMSKRERPKASDL